MPAFILGARIPDGYVSSRIYQHKGKRKRKKDEKRRDAGYTHA